MNSTDPKPTVTLYTNHLSPNGLKISIYLEELKLVDPKAFHYRIEKVDVTRGAHKDPQFLALNPNGRIPVLVDHSLDNFVIFESAAILLHLELHYDVKKRFSFDVTKSPREYSTMLQWVFFGHGNLSPMQGQAHFYLFFANVDVPYGKKSKGVYIAVVALAKSLGEYHDETKRIYSILDDALEGRDWLAGVQPGQYSIADMNIFPWLRLHRRAGIETLNAWPNLKAWLERSLSRPGVEAGIQSVARG